MRRRRLERRVKDIHTGGSNAKTPVGTFISLWKADGDLRSLIREVLQSTLSTRETYSSIEQPHETRCDVFDSCLSPNRNGSMTPFQKRYIGLLVGD